MDESSKWLFILFVVFAAVAGLGLLITLVWALWTFGGWLAIKLGMDTSTTFALRIVVVLIGIALSRGFKPVVTIKK